MRICFVAPTTNLSGNVTTAERICALLQQAGHDVLQIAPSDMASTTGKEFDCCFYLHALRCGSVVWKSTDPSIRAKKYVLILGGTDANEKHHADSEAEMLRVVETSDSIVCFSDAMVAAALSKWGDCARSKLVVISQSIAPCPNDHSEVTLDSLVGGTSPVVLLPAGLRPVKGIDFALDAWHLVRAKADVALLIIGPPLDEETHRSVVAAAQADASIVYAEGIARCDLIGLMTSSRALCAVNTSRSEGQPQALMEAMLVGCMCVARDIPGNVAVLDHETGFLVHTPDELASTIESLLTLDDSVRQAKLLAAAERMKRCHNEALELEQYAAVLPIV